MPDRLPSLVVLAGFWVPPLAAGWWWARVRARGAFRAHGAVAYVLPALLVAGYAAAWFWFNAERMPPYVPGAGPDPVNPPPAGTVRWLATFTAAAILPGSGVACALGYRAGRKGR